jgi:glycosyltransferase involved in cell wall biosynthesis
MQDAIRLEADIVLECGYASAAPWYPFLRRRRIKLVTHMDGMEWQRAKWNKPGRFLFRRAESMAVRYSDAIVCDHPEIAGYYTRNYRVYPEIIPYGADLGSDWDSACLRPLNLEEGSYFLLTARLEPENNIRMIVEGFLAAKIPETLVIVGAYSGNYGKALHRRYASYPNIRFIGALYDVARLDSIRHYSKAVFHGHSVGGTNPSLLEAMASAVPIVSHDNVYNRWVLGGNALFFSSSGQISQLLDRIDTMKDAMEEMVQANLNRISREFQWEVVVLRYQESFEKLLGNKSG